MALTEQIELLGKNMYNGEIPNMLTLQAIPTVSELEYISAEDFDTTMLTKILPQAIKENIDTTKLLEVDYQWILRCLRILNYGPYFTTNTLFCGHCGKVHYGEYQVNLTSVGCKPIPDNFTGHVTLTEDEFLDYNGTVSIKLLTMSAVLNAYKDTVFKTSSGKQDKTLARMCYMITQANNTTNLTPLEAKLFIENELSSADYMILKERVSELTDYGLRGGGTCTCPVCGGGEASFIAMTDDRYFRPTLGDLREWKRNRSKRSVKELLRNTKAVV